MRAGGARVRGGHGPRSGLGPRRVRAGARRSAAPRRAAVWKRDPAPLTPGCGVPGCGPRRRSGPAGGPSGLSSLGWEPRGAAGPLALSSCPL